MHQLQMHQFQQKLQQGHGGLGGLNGGLNVHSGNEDEEQRKSTLRVGPKRQSGGPGSPTAPILKYLRARIRNLFHVPLSVLNKSACILSDAAFVEALPVAWELLRYLQPKSLYRSRAGSHFNGKNMRFGLIMGRLSILKKKFGPIMSNI